MELQLADGSYINTRHIVSFFIDGVISILTVHGDVCSLLITKHDAVDQELLDLTVRVISVKRSRQPLLNQHELWQEIHRLK